MKIPDPMNSDNPQNNTICTKEPKETWEPDLNRTVEDATEANPIFKDLVDLKNGAVGLLRSTVRHIVYMKYHIRHLQFLPTKMATKNPNLPQPHFSFLSLNSIYLSGYSIQESITAILSFSLSLSVRFEQLKRDLASGFWKSENTPSIFSSKFSLWNRKKIKNLVIFYILQRGNIRHERDRERECVG